MPHCPRCRSAIPIRRIFSWSSGTVIACPKCDAALEPVRWRLGVANGLGMFVGMSAGDFLGVNGLPLRMVAFALGYMVVWPTSYLLLVRFRVVTKLSVLSSRATFR